MTTLLIVDDELAYRETLAFNFSRDGYQVVTAASGRGALEAWNASAPDLILLDLMIPGISGVEVCRRIRETSQVPIIMVTAKDGEVDKIVGLEIGADDYVTKPYSYRELLARVRAVLRRGGAVAQVEGGEVLEAGPIRMDVDRHEVYMRGEEITMPLREFDLLELFLRNPHRVLTRGQILDRIWGPDYIGDTKTLDVHVNRLRVKFEDVPAKPTLIKTVRGLGYKLSPPEDEPGTPG